MRRFRLLTARCVLSSAMIAALGSVLAAQSNTSKLAVQVTYKGLGTVDESHKVFVVLWDTPDFAKEASDVRPIYMETMSSKTGSVQFNNIKKSPVYISMVYDPSGKWGAMSAPPVGSSVGLYGRPPETPAAIDLEPGKTAKIEATFDDSYKMK